MATLADIKTRIITETARDDLEDDLAAQLLTHIQRACEHYGAHRFWFNAAVMTFSTEAGAPVAELPLSLRRIDRLTIPAQRINLREVILPELDDMESIGAGVPELYAYQGDSVRLSPVPSAIYTMQAYGVARINAPAIDTDASAWTNEAQDLIVNHAKMTLYRDQFRDAQGAQMAMGATQDALNRLRRETAERLRAPLRMPAGTPWGCG